VAASALLDEIALREFRVDHLRRDVCRDVRRVVVRLAWFQNAGLERSRVQRACGENAGKGGGCKQSGAGSHALFHTCFRPPGNSPFTPCQRSTAVEQWYSMLFVPKHHITSLLSCGT